MAADLAGAVEDEGVDRPDPSPAGIGFETFGIERPEEQRRKAALGDTV